MTAPATPTPLDWIIDSGYDLFMEYATPLDIEALAVTRAIVEAALVVRTHCDNPGNDDDGSRWDGCLESLLDAAAAYRAWTPATATGSGDGGEKSA